MSDDTRVQNVTDLEEEAWGIIANVNPWEAQTPDWQEAVLRFRDRYHAKLGGRLVEDDDPNRQLGSFVEGFMFGLIDWNRMQNLPGGWEHKLADDATGTHALYFVSPSGLRWRIRAELEEES